jgi:single-strand DNA-binding protein
MARTFCEVQILGYVGKDPEIRSTDGGMLIANFSIATTERFKKQNGEQVEKTEWHNLVAFKNGAEIIRNYVKKGDLVLVKGKLQTTSWDDAIPHDCCVPLHQHAVRQEWQPERQNRCR